MVSLILALLLGADPNGGAAAALQAIPRRTDTHVQFLFQPGATIVDITSALGIDGAVISRHSNHWPQALAVRMHLGGLESFQVANGPVSVEWSVPSSGPGDARVTLHKGKNESALGKQSPYYSAVRTVGGNGKIPLKNGYFEVPLPAKLFDGNPRQIELHWVDFYRN